jgi:hypothetical protein
MKVQSRRSLCLGVAISATIVIAVLVYRAVNPPDRVAIVVTNLPKGTYYASMIVETDMGLANLPWYPHKLFAFTMEPHDCGWSYNKKGSIGIHWNAFVQWKWGRRYGVATRGKEQQWLVTWFPPSKSTVHDSLLFFGGGKVTLSCSEGKTATLSEADVKSLGLGSVCDPE